MEFVTTSGIHVSQFGDEIQAIILSYFTSGEYAKLAASPIAISVLPSIPRFREWCLREIKYGLDARRVFDIVEDEHFVSGDKHLAYKAPDSDSTIQSFDSVAERAAFEVAESASYGFAWNFGPMPFRPSALVDFTAAQSLVVPIWRGIVAEIVDMNTFELRKQNGGGGGNGGVDRADPLSPAPLSRPLRRNTADFRGTANGSMHFLVSGCDKRIAVVVERIPPTVMARIVCRDNAELPGVERFLMHYSQEAVKKTTYGQLHSFGVGSGTKSTLWDLYLSSENNLREIPLSGLLDALFKKAHEQRRVCPHSPDDRSSCGIDNLCTDPDQDPTEYEKADGVLFSRATERSLIDFFTLLIRQCPSRYGLQGAHQLFDGSIETAERDLLLETLDSEQMVPQLCGFWRECDPPAGEIKTPLSSGALPSSTGALHSSSNVLPIREFGIYLAWNLTGAQDLPRFDLLSAIIGFCLERGASYLLQRALVLEATLPFQMPPVPLPRSSTDTVYLKWQRFLKKYAAELTPRFDYRHKPLSSFSTHLRAMHKSGWAWRKSLF